MQLEADLRPAGMLGLKVLRTPGRTIWPQRELTLAEIGKYGMPQRGLPDEVNQWRRANRPNLARGLRKVLAARALKIPHFYGQLFLTKIGPDGEPLDLGLASMRVVTANGVKAITDALAGTGTPLTNENFHGFGTGVGAEAATDTALGTEETTQYATDNTRPTGTGRVSATSGNNATYTTVGTYSPDSGATRAITEHGVFSQAATGGGTLLDRSVFAAVNLVAGADSLQATYVMTVNSGGA